MFIFFTISTFGPQFLSVITTTRKIITVLVSIFMFNHEMDPIRWICVLIVFSAVGSELQENVFKKSDHKKNKNVKPDYELVTTEENK